PDCFLLFYIFFSFFSSFSSFFLYYFPIIFPCASQSSSCILIFCFCWIIYKFNFFSFFIVALCDFKSFAYVFMFFDFFNCFFRFFRFFSFSFCYAIMSFYRISYNVFSFCIIYKIYNVFWSNIYPYSAFLKNFHLFLYTFSFI